MMDSVARLRFAPSPTGSPHVGSLHTALFNWALSRALDGDFILRIDDTDAARNSAEFSQEMIDALHWLGIDWDEGPDIGGEFGPYIQSQRLKRHLEIANTLVEQGAAYHTEGAIWLKMPKTGTTILHDVLRNDIEFDNALLEDRVIVRSNGTALYQLASAVDDHDMGITHVLRGEDWISSAPIQIAIYNAMGWKQPVWAHLPLILNSKRQKLSKRDPEGGYLSRDFQQAGFLPQALWNYLLLLGWSPDGTQELLTKWDVRKQFKLEKLSPSASIFDWGKLRWMNQQYIQKLSTADLATRLRDFLEDAYGALPSSNRWLHDLTAAVRDELAVLEDVIDSAEWAFDQPDLTAEAKAYLQSEPARPVLTQLLAEVATVVLLDEATGTSIVKSIRQRMKTQFGWQAKQVLLPIRAALTGRTGGPALGSVMGILGKQRTIERIGAALK